MKARSLSLLLPLTLLLSGCNDSSSETSLVTSHIQSLEFDHPDDSDLEPIHQAVMGKSFIGLGETTHGGAKGFKAKSRITKYLHQAGDIDVLAMESGLYDGLRLWQRLQDKEITNVRDAMLYSFMFLYAETPEIYPLYRYVEQQAFTDDPLILVAFDGRHSSDPACSVMLPEMQTFIEQHQLLSLDWPGFISSGQAMMCPWYFVEPDTKEKKRFISQLVELKEVLSQMKAEQVLPPPEQRKDFREYATFWLQVVKSMQAHVQDRWFDTFNPNEIMQADNLRWLQTEWFPGQRILAWGHNVHISAYVGSWPDSIGAFSHLKTMTDPDNVYSLIHAFAEGHITPLEADLSERSKPMYISHDKHSVEQLLANEGIDQAFIKMADIADMPEAKSIIYQPIETSQELADGIIYTRFETPSSIDSPR
ncbi:erythromycin esterase family protein [Vibrio sp. CAU 1672]|uniref:erythromycin esterase family protein n=1 Tax=Vibrio sp. CAU 1672 TaxID=3032594 RepID=UPI0023DABFD4|nr:erythromycin esterase family protein [Vibrio sp. CAU 1672]MDF2155000.1 erythromycin esterase family protein [Vibrio sp. CAU 1672]